MDELFGEVGFAQADLARKEQIENDVGLTALLNGDEAPAEKAMPDEKSDSDRENGEKVE